MADEMSIKQLFQTMQGKQAEILQGVVLSTSPLRIQAVNDAKHLIGENSLIVPWHLTDYTTEVTVNWSTENTSGGSGYAEYASHKHPIQGRKTITVHNSLKKGDKVHLLAVNNGKVYFVLDRVR